MGVRVPLIIVCCVMIVTFVGPSILEAQPMRPESRQFEPYEGMPYGRHCPGMGRGPYGARKQVKTAEEAKRMIEAYYAASGHAVTVGNIEERKGFFAAEVAGPNGKIIDRIIVHKRSGRIRSIY